MPRGNRETDPLPSGPSPGRLRQHENSDLSPGPVDPFANLNRDQVRAVQHDLNGHGQRLAEDGVVGPKTRAAYQAIYGADAAPVQRILAAPPPAPAPGPQPSAGGPGPSAGGPAPAAAPQSVEDQVRSKYGYMAWALDQPEIGPILRQAASEGWDDARLRGAIEQTAWWRNTSDSSRLWQQKIHEDPASAERQVAGQADSIMATAAKIGIGIDLNRARQIATDSFAQGWSSQQLQSAILAEFHYAAGQTTGQAAQLDRQFRQMAGDYEVPIDDGTIGQWVTQAVRQEQDPEAFRQHLIDQAKGLYKGIASELDKGLTVRQASATYRTLAAQELGVDPNTINWQDPKWGRALNYQDPKTGQFLAMDQYQWQTTLRSDPVYGWNKTAKGRQAADDFTLRFLQAIGKAPAA